MRKSKLDKLIEKNSEKREPDYSLLEKAKEELRERNARKNRIRKFNRKNLAKVLVPLCCVIIVIVVAVILFVLR
ncbi:MAG: hypothetical protein K2H36_03945 [Clostridia bacterium]|nr:hypothetical protein [Clostridia bacterium]MDE6758369.1 hypothetical protein [Clostridia bacterium]